MGWHTYANRGKPLEAFKITAPPSQNAVEQLLALQEAISQVEASIQAGNIFLLKVRALLFAALPQVNHETRLDRNIFVYLAFLKCTCNKI